MPSPREPEPGKLSVDERAELAMLRDVAGRLLNFDGGAELLPWVHAHRHHQDEPYIGCPFCRDEFVRKPMVGFIGDGHTGGIVVNGKDVGLNGIDTREACEIADKIRAALNA